MTLKLAGLTWDDIALEKLNLKDEKVYKEIFQKGNTLGVFQLESHEATDMLKEMSADCIENIIDVNALNRTAILSVGMHKEYIKNKKFPDKIKHIHPDMIEITKHTNGIMLYQEQALNIFRLAGFPEDEVDNARRAIGKKIPEKLAQLKVQLIDGLMTNRGWTQEQAEEIWRLLEAQSSYSFNAGHKVLCHYTEMCG